MEKTQKPKPQNVSLPQDLVDDLIKFKDWFREADDKFDEHLDSTYIVSNVYHQPAGIVVVRQWLDKFEKGKSKKNSPYRYYAPPSLSKRLRYAV